MHENDANLDALVGAIESLKETIRRDHATIGANETRTRNALIDPLLKALGWGDSSLLTPEYLIRYGTRPSDYGVVDYALHAPNDRANPVVIIEAKRMSEELVDAHREQALNYALDRGKSVRYWGLTNGDRWEFYKISKDESRIVLNVSVREESAIHCAEMFRNEFPIWNERNGSLELPKSHVPGPQDSAALQKQIEVLPSLSVGSARPTNILRVMTWFGITCFLSVVVGYVVGFRAAEPVGGAFAAFGIGVVSVFLIAVAYSARALLRSALRSLSHILRSQDSYSLASEDRRKTLTWVAAAVISAVLGGGVLGYLAGLRSAQSVVNILEGVGVFTFWTVIISVLALIFFAIMRGGNSRRYTSQRRGRSRRSSRRRR